MRETLKAKGYDLNQVEAGAAQIDDDLMRLLEKLSDDKPVIQEKGQEGPELTILRRKETANNTDSSKGSVTDSKDVVRSLVDKIPENILEDTGQHVKGVLLKIHDGLGQIPATGSRSLQQYTALNDGHQSFHDVDGQGEGNASNILLPGIRGEEDVASGICEGSDQKTTRAKRAMQEEHGASANETTQER